MPSLPHSSLETCENLQLTFLALLKFLRKGLSREIIPSRDFRLWPWELKSGDKGNGCLPSPHERQCFTVYQLIQREEVRTGTPARSSESLWVNTMTLPAFETRRQELILSLILLFLLMSLTLEFDWEKTRERGGMLVAFDNLLRSEYQKLLTTEVEISEGSSKPNCSSRIPALRGEEGGS